MEKFVKNLFDFQKIANNKKMAAIIDETNQKYGDNLSEAELENVTAGLSTNQYQLFMQKKKDD